MKVIANGTFNHGNKSFKRGETVDVPAATARELESARLVRIVEEKKAPAPENKMADKPANKAKKAED